MEKIVILANRLAESILFDWDKEEVIKLAKEVAVACKENIDFTSLVKRMREAQKQWKDGDPFDGTEMELAKRMQEAEKEVDEYLKKMDRTSTFAEAIHWADTHPNWIKRPDLPPHPDDTTIDVYNEIKAACPVVLREFRYYFPESQPQEKYYVITSMKEEDNPSGAAMFLQGVTHYLPITLPKED